MSKANATTTDVINYGPFGKVTVYKPLTTPKSLVLFISGDGGWNQGVVSMAKNIVDQGAVVLGINITTYYKNIKKGKSICYYPASDFENLSLEIQKKYQFKTYLKPILIGYSSGATLVYGALAQAPANTFKGVIALGFSPDIELDKTLCNGSGLTTRVYKPGKSFYLNPSEKLTAPFIVLQGTIDQVCPYSDALTYMKLVNTEQLITLPKVGHGFSVTKNWLPQFITAYNKIVNTITYQEKVNQDNKLKVTRTAEKIPVNMPLAVIHTVVNDDSPLAFMISGDGGWTSFDQSLGEQFSKKGIPVIGLDAQNYFWNVKTPKKSAEDVASAIEYYMELWHKKSCILVGYSFGASVIPFIANDFPSVLKEKVKGVYSLSPDTTADFEIHLLDMLQVNNTERYNVISEIKKIKTLNPVCFFGSEEDENIRKQFDSNGLKVVKLIGDHHFNNSFESIVDNVVKFISNK